MNLRGVGFLALIVLEQVVISHGNLLSGELYICDHDAGDKVANIEIVVEPNERQFMYVHGSSAFRYLRIRAKITGCRETALYSEKYLIPGDLGLASGNFQYLLELSSGIERGQHVFHVTRAEENKHGVHTHVNKAFNESIAMGTGLGCGQVHSYLPEAFGATLCTPYRPHHARDANGNHTFRVYAPNTKDVTANYPVPPQETTDLNWKPFIPWLIIHYFNLRSWESRAQGMALVCTLGMYLVYLLFKSRRVTRHYTTQEQERADGRIV